MFARCTAAMAIAALMLADAPARADAVADFYKGKQVSLIVGYGTGGGYDVYGRLFARHLGRHIPGNPNVVVQNMPGAGSLRAVNHLYNTAPKDGTAIATFGRDMPLLGVIGHNPNVRFDARKFTWLGSSSSYANDAYFLFVRKDAAVKSIEDARRPGGPPLVLGGTAEGSTGNDVPILLRDALGLNIKLIAGYPDGAAIFIAVDRKEVDGRLVGLSATQSAHPEWLSPDSNMRNAAAVRARHPPPAFCRRADRAGACAQRSGARADRTCGTALPAVAAVRGAARRSGRPRAGAAGGVPGGPSGPAVSRGSRAPEDRREPDRRRRGAARHRRHRGGAARAARLHAQAAHREQGRRLGSLNKSGTLDSLRICATGSTSPRLRGEVASEASG